MSKSIATSRYTGVAAFKAIDRIIGPDRINTPTTPEQRRWLSETYAPCSDELVCIPEIDSHATRYPEDYNAFITKHGWPAETVKCPPNGFLTTGMLDILVSWLKPGKKTKLNIDNMGEFSAAQLIAGVTLHRHKKNGTIVVTLMTTTTDTVLLAMADRVPTDVPALNRMTDEIFDDPGEPVYDYDGVIFPMVKLASQHELSSLAGIETRERNSSGDPFRVVKMSQQATLKMNHEGARARAKDVMLVLPTSVPQPFQIDRPFLVAFRRKTLTRHLFEGYVAHDAWQDPSDLGI